MHSVLVPRLLFACAFAEHIFYFIMYAEATVHRPHRGYMRTLSTREKWKMKICIADSHSHAHTRGGAERVGDWRRLSLSSWWPRRLSEHVQIECNFHWMHFVDDMRTEH